jgi:hypothetical protein
MNSPLKNREVRLRGLHRIGPKPIINREAPSG